MHIDRLIVRNFRCFEDSAFHLMPGINIVIGQNGSGKTAFLEAMLVAIGAWLLGLKGTPSQAIRRNDVRLVGQREGEEVTFAEQYPVEIIAEGWLEGQHITWSRSLNTPEGKTTHGNTLQIKQIANEADRKVRAGEEVTLPLVAYYGTGRLWHSPNLANTRNDYSRRELARYTGYQDALSERINANELARWMERQDRISYQQRQEPVIYQAVRQAMKQMLTQAIEVRFDNKRLEVVVEFEDGSIQPFSHLSDGQRNMVALAGDIAMRMARLNPHLGVEVLHQTPGIILIDELDLHLHPEWQRHIVADLTTAFPRTQIVATTHSPQIISEIEPRNLTFLVKEDQKFIARPGTQAYGLDTNWILEHIMDVPARPERAQRVIRHVEDALEEGHIEEARDALQNLRVLLHGDDGTVARLEASINNLEALGDEIYSEAR